MRFFTVALMALRWLLLLTREVALRGERSALDFLFEALLFAFPTVGALVVPRRRLGTRMPKAASHHIDSFQYDLYDSQNIHSKFIGFCFHS